jgi:diadenosine tetraphosphate (Ap4A) HIT family hydrolase
MVEVKMGYDKDNVFAKIIDGRIGAEKLYEDELVIAIKDIAPAAPVHILVIPKNPYTDFADFVQRAKDEEVMHYNRVVIDLASKYSNGHYRLITNKGEHAGQSVFHFHTHILSDFHDKALLR